MPGTEDSPVDPPVQPPDRGPAGPTGKTGETGASGPVASRSFKFWAAVLLALTVVLSGGALISQQLQQRSFEETIAANHQANLDRQAAQSAAIEAKLCSIFLPIASLKAPSGSPVDNPSRAFEQQLESRLAQVAPALDCKK